MASSFTFDPVFFEEECLGRFLRLESDPTEDGPIYLLEREEKLVQVMCAAAVVDAHSFPNQPLPMELDQRPDRPDICIGTDPFHTPAPLVEALVDTCRALDWTVRINAPYAGAIVPRSFFRQDPRVHSVLIEVNRRLYLEPDARPVRRSTDFDAVRRGVDALMHVTVEVERLDAGES